MRPYEDIKTCKTEIDLFLTLQPELINKMALWEQSIFCSCVITSFIYGLVLSLIKHSQVYDVASFFVGDVCPLGQA